MGHYRNKRISSGTDCVQWSYWYGFRPPLATVVSAEPFSHGTGTLRCLEKEIATYRHWSVSLWREPDDVSHCRILSPNNTKWRLISATLCGWRHCFVVDQLWFMTRIQEEEDLNKCIITWLSLLQQLARCFVTIELCAHGKYAAFLIGF